MRRLGRGQGVAASSTSSLSGPGEHLAGLVGTGPAKVSGLEGGLRLFPAMVSSAHCRHHPPAQNVEAVDGPPKSEKPEVLLLF